MISNVIDRIRLLFVTEKKPFLELKEILGFYPRNIKLYRLALMHKSVAYFERERMKHSEVECTCGQHDTKSGKKKAAKGKKDKEDKARSNFASTMALNNERLEYLGDAMLGAIVADILYKHYGNKQEGFLTSLRSKLVCRKTLNALAVDMGLDKLILYTGAMTTGHNSYMNGNAFEAFIGAIYLDRGFNYCYKFLEDRVFKHYIDINKIETMEANHKSALIEWCQKRKMKFAFSQVEQREKNSRSTPVFNSVVAIEGIECGAGKGYTKKEGDQKAAMNALSKLRSNQALVGQLRNARDKRQNSRQEEHQEESCE